MNDTVATVKASRPKRRFRLQVEVDAMPFDWEGEARNDQQAARHALRDIGGRYHLDLTTARVITCVEVSP